VSQFEVRATVSLTNGRFRAHTLIMEDVLERGDQFQAYLESTAVFLGSSMYKLPYVTTTSHHSVSVSRGYECNKTHFKGCGGM